MPPTKDRPDAQVDAQVDARVESSQHESPPPDVSYAYKASLVGGARRFTLTDAGLAWVVGAKSGVWRYRDIAAVRLSFRPVSMQSRRFRADVQNEFGERLTILSTTWQTVALMAPQDKAYRAFIVALHARLAAAQSGAVLTAGLKPFPYAASIAVLALVATAMAGLLARAVATGSPAAALFLLGFAVLFGWQIGGFMRRNKPRIYRIDELPEDVLP